LSNSSDREIERLMRSLTGTGLSRRRLMRHAGAGALGLSVAGFLAACGDDDSGGPEDAKVIPKAQPADVLNFSNWPLYIDEDRDTFKDFRKKYGTRVKYTEEINDNVEFFGKVRQQLERGQSGGRDLFAVTDWMADRMIRLGYVQKLDKSVLPNVTKNLQPALRSPGWDPNRDFSVPWQSGMTGLIARTDKVQPKSINDIFDPKLKGKVGLVLLGDGKDPTKASLDEALEAVEKIDKANRDGQVRRFTGNDYTKDLASGNAELVFGWSGDGVQLEAENKNIKFVVPDEGVMLWSDNMQIPVGAPNPYTAELMMNFVYDPEIQARIAAYVNYVTPVRGVKEIIERDDPELASNQLIFPDDATLEKTHLHQELSPEDEAELDGAFQEVIGA
jgi:spermidine/putrescine transport system substrate-binding protein